MNEFVSMLKGVPVHTILIISDKCYYNIEKRGVAGIKEVFRKDKNHLALSVDFFYRYLPTLDH